MGSDTQCTTIEQNDGSDLIPMCDFMCSNSGFHEQTNFYSIIGCNIQGFNTKKQKHNVQQISKLSNNENILINTVTETHLNEKNTCP